MRTEQILVQVLHSEPIVGVGIASILGAVDDIVLLRSERGLAGVADADVVIADYAAGISLSAWVARERVAARILIVTRNDKEWDIRHALESGVLGYLLQGCTQGELLEAVRAVAQGLRYLTHSAMCRMTDGVGRNELTARETDVLQLLGKGHCNKLIARDLGIGVGTVKAHLNRILSKLGATARTHAVVVAAQRGLILSAGTPNQGARKQGPYPKRVLATTGSPRDSAG